MLIQYPRLVVRATVIGSLLASMGAHAVVVPPPMAPGSLGGQNTQTQQVPAQAPLVTVDIPSEKLSAAQVTSAPQPTSGQPQLLEIQIPAAPEPPPVITLKPEAPGARKADVKKTDRTADKPKKISFTDDTPAPTKRTDDPFLGVAGTPVSDSQLNRFVFPEPVEGVYFQEGAPLPECPEKATATDPCKPVFLNGRRMMLLQLRAGAQGPIQMLVHLHSGRVVTINLAPAKGPGAVVRIDGAEDGTSDARTLEAKASTSAPAAGLTASERDVALLSRFAKGDIPPGFAAIGVGKPTRYQLFDVVPMATWSNGSTLKAHLMQVRSKSETPIAINPGLFRSESVKAVALDRDTLVSGKPAMLYLLEQVEEGR